MSSSFLLIWTYKKYYGSRATLYRLCALYLLHTLFYPKSLIKRWRRYKYYRTGITQSIKTNLSNKTKQKIPRYEISCQKRKTKYYNRWSSSSVRWWSKKWWRSKKASKSGLSPIKSAKQTYSRRYTWWKSWKERWSCKANHSVNRSFEDNNWT